MTTRERDAAGAYTTRALTLELTKGCNLRCGYCYYAQREDAYDPRERMSGEVARRSVDLLFEEGSDPGPVHLHFFGGEPLLDFPLLRETLLHGLRRSAEEGKAITFEVTTNGTRFSDEVVTFLNEHEVRVGVSFDGPPEIQDVSRPLLGGSSYDQAVPGIRRLLDSRRGTELEPLTHCSVVVTRRGFDLRVIVAHLEELGFGKIILTPATDLSGESHGFREEDLDSVLREYDRLAEDYEDAVAAGRPVAPNWFPTLMGRLLSGERREFFCQGGQDYLGVQADGSLSLCYRFYEDPEFSMGSVQEGVDRSVTDRIRSQTVDERTTCSRCWARHFCGGGCHHDNLQSGGAIHEPNPVNCEIFRHSMGRTLEAWGRLSRAGRLPGRGPVQGGSGEASAGIGPDRNERRAPSMSAGENGGTQGSGDAPRAAAGCHVRDLDGEQVVYDPSTHEVCVLNETAAFVFGLCDGSRSRAQLLEALSERYDAPAEVLARDLDQVLADLGARALLS